MKLGILLLYLVQVALLFKLSRGLTGKCMLKVAH